MNLPKHSGWNQSDIAAIITMSAPNSLAPARLDSTINTLYESISHMENNQTAALIPTLAMCGGSTDSLVPSESCPLPELRASAAFRIKNELGFRRTVHTTSLPGIWTGVGHREMVWCHQVRWRVARAALELGRAGGVSSVAHLSFDRWLPPTVIEDHPKSDPGHVRFTLKNPEFTIPTSAVLRLSNPLGSNHVYLVRIPRKSETSQFSLLLARGILNVPRLAQHMQPISDNSLRVSLFHCISTSSASTAPNWSSCVPIVSSSNTTASLLPLPIEGDSFPGREGVDEADTMLYFSSWISQRDQRMDSSEEWVAVQVLGSTGTRGWIAGGFDQEVVHNGVSSIPGKSYLTLTLSKC